MSLTVLTLLLGTAVAAGAAGSAAAPSAHPRVTLDTTMGKIVLELYPEKAPKTVANFVAYVKAGHYDNTMFHRVIKGFMIQGGGLDANGQEKPTNPPVHNEADNGLTNDRGTVAMARTSDPHSATAQFFVNLTNNTFLNYQSKSPAGWGYTVFGKVVEGMDVVDKIAQVPVDRGPYSEAVPSTPILIRKATVS